MRIDVLMRRGDARIQRRHFLEHALPERVPLLHGVALVGHADFREAVRLRVFERVADDAVHTFIGVHFFLDRDLIVGAGLEAAADADIHAFGVLAEHDEVDVVPAAVLERAQAIVEQPHRTVVDVEIELEAGAEQDVARMPVVGDPRVAKRANEDGVELAQQLIAIGRQRFTGLQIVVGAPWQMFELHAPAEDFAGGFQDLHRLCRDVLADPVPGDNCNPHMKLRMMISNDCSNSAFVSNAPRQRSETGLTPKTLQFTPVFS